MIRRHHVILATVALGLGLATACGAPDEAAESPEGAVSAEGAAPELNVPERPLPIPTGPHALGMTEFVWVDEARPEPFTRDADDVRTVLVRAWYPAAANGEETALYIQGMDEFGDNQDFVPVTHVRTNAVLDAAPADSGPYPVLIYNHGGGWSRFTSSFTTEELASHGYVVVSIDHNGFNHTQVLPDGSSVVPDTLTFPEPSGDLMADALGSWDFLDEHHFPSWVADTRFVLDQLEEANRAGPLAGTMDLTQVGMFGWSFGGATSIEASVVDDRVKAAIDHDGQLFGTAKTAGTSRPFMLMHGGAQPEAPPTEDPAEAERTAEVMEQLMAIVRDTDQSLKDNSTNDWYDLTIADATHGHFSDLVLFIPGAEGNLPALRGYEIINGLTVAFFDRYLKGIESPLLEDPTDAYPEVTFDRHVQP